MICDIYKITMIQEQLNEERAMKIDQQPINAVSSQEYQPYSLWLDVYYNFIIIIINVN